MALSKQQFEKPPTFLMTDTVRTKKGTLRIKPRSVFGESAISKPIENLTLQHRDFTKLAQSWINGYRAREGREGLPRVQDAEWQNEATRVLLRNPFASSTDLQRFIGTTLAGAYSENKIAVPLKALADVITGVESAVVEARYLARETQQSPIERFVGTLDTWDAQNKVDFVIVDHDPATGSVNIIFEQIKTGQIEKDEMDQIWIAHQKLLNTFATCQTRNEELARMQRVREYQELLPQKDLVTIDPLVDSFSIALSELFSEAELAKNPMDSDGKLRPEIEEAFHRIIPLSGIPSDQWVAAGLSPMVQPVLVFVADELASVETEQKAKEIKKCVPFLGAAWRAWSESELEKTATSPNVTSKELYHRDGDIVRDPKSLFTYYSRVVCGSGASRKVTMTPLYAT